MSHKAYPKAKHKFSDDQVQIQEVENERDMDTKMELEAVLSSGSCNETNDRDDIESDSKPCLRKKLRNVDNRINKTTDPNVKYKGPSKPSLKSRLERTECKFKKTLTPLPALKPLGALQKKPMLDFCEQKEDRYQVLEPTQGFSSNNHDIVAYRIGYNNVCVMSDSGEDVSESLRQENADKINFTPVQDEKSKETEFGETDFVESERIGFSNDNVQSAMRRTLDGEVIGESENNIGNLRIESAIENDTELNQRKSVFQRTVKIVGHTCLSKRIKSTSLTSEDFETTAGQLVETKISSLLKVLRHCPEGADIKLSLFMAACSHDPRTIQPFPVKLFEDNDINRYRLYYMAEEVPCIHMISFLLREMEDPPTIKKELIPLVDWLVRNDDPRLELVKPTDCQNILEQISKVEVLPNMVFRIKNKRNSEVEVSWQDIKGEEQTKYAYHNCKVHDAYSTLHYGLHNGLNKRGVFGPGIYLTNNLAACLNSCEPGNTWGKSIIATKVKLAFITEFIANHNVTIYSGIGRPFLSSSSKHEDTETEEWSYYFLKKPKLARLRYLLVYITRESTLPKNPFFLVPFRKRLIKYINIIRISLLLVTILMGATASKRSVENPSTFLSMVHSCYHKVSNDFVDWPIWKYVETPYLAIHLSDSVPHTCCTSI